ncbi:MAG: hexokinase [Treponema sp.]|nr:hexokinase [Spirochaetia bacterium]MDY4902708.1 hexokinase [Treponema sp.]
MNNLAAAFLGRHNFSIHQDINSVVDGILFDMNEGLSKRKSGQDMILTYANPPETKRVNTSVIVIDAGGTNFRSCLVTFDSDGKASISDMEKTKMPGIEKELSKTEFFNQIAQNLEHLKDKADLIGFCFSYPVTITEDGDGILIGFSKEVKAPEVAGCVIGRELKRVLKEHGWKKDLTVKLLNDTVSALLACAADVPKGKEYSSYVGFILGTGMNAAYIQSEDERYPGLKKQIIVCEIAKYNCPPRSDFDIAYDNKSEKPGGSVFEKMCSGAYLGSIAYEVITLAAKENVFSEKLNRAFEKLESLSLIEMDSFLHKPFDDTTLLGKIIKESGTEKDAEILFELLDCLVERCARFASASLAACVIKCGEGKNPLRPVAILCNGTTFFKTYKVQQRVQGYLEEVLVKEKGLHFELIQKENDITLGTALIG